MLANIPSSHFHSVSNKYAHTFKQTENLCRNLDIFFDEIPRVRIQPYQQNDAQTLKTRSFMFYLLIRRVFSSFILIRRNIPTLPFVGKQKTMKNCVSVEKFISYEFYNYRRWYDAARKKKGLEKFYQKLNEMDIRRNGWKKRKVF